MKRNELILFIEQVVNQTISEIATGVDQAAQSGMALYVSDKGSSRSFILYNPGELRRALEDPAYEKRLHLNPGNEFLKTVESELPNFNPIEKLDQLANKFFNGKNEGWL